MTYLSSFLQYAGFAAEFLLLLLLLRGPVRSFKILFLYCLVHFVSTWVEISVLNTFGNRSVVYRRTYWTFEIIIDLLLFVLVGTLTYRVMEGNPHKSKVGRLLLVVAAAVILLPLAIYYQRAVFSNAWFNGIGQFLNFGAAVMTFALWGAVVSTRTRDLRLLTVAAGLGLAVTGYAIAFGLRQLFSSTGLARDFANLFGPFTFLASMLIWCWAFRGKSATADVPTSSRAPAG